LQSETDYDGTSPRPPPTLPPLSYFFFFSLSLSLSLSLSRGVVPRGSLMKYVNAPGVYLWCCCLILAGNTAAPMCIRGIVRTMHYFANPLRLDRSREERRESRLLHPLRLARP
jgi:hypothetical protein